MDFELVTEVTADGDIPVRKFSIGLTGINVVFVRSNSPKVETFVTLPIEVHDDSGVANALERLIFMGSKKYPYRNFLKLIANRGMVKNVDSWADIE